MEAEKKTASVPSRRDFLKAMGLGAAGLSLPAMAGPFQSPGAGVEHFVPADKKLREEWVRELFSRGESRVYRGKELDAIGMPVGGIASGQLYLRGDGTLAEWRIFNKHHFSGYGADNYRFHAHESPIGQGFAVSVLDPAGGPPLRAALDREGFPGVESIGEYPIGRVRYAREGFPLKVEMEAFSPFIPLNAKDSALPATVFHISLENVSGRPLRAAVAGWLENAVCFHSAPDREGFRESRVVREKDRTLLVHSAVEAPAEEKTPPRARVVLADFEGGDYGDWKVTGEAFGARPARGTLPNQQKVSGFVGIGLVNTFLGGDAPWGTLTSPPFTITRKYLNFLLGGGGHDGQTCLNLLIDGQSARSAAGRDNEKLEWRSFRVAHLEGREARIEIVDRHSGGWGHINVDQIELADERAGGPAGPLDKLEDHGTMALAFAGRAGAMAPDQESARYPIAEKRAGGLAAEPAELPAGAKHTFRFVLSWHFPNHPRGQAYATRFKTAPEVAHYVLDNIERLTGDTRKWHDTYYDSTLPRWLLDRLHAPLSNLATGTCQWWGNGRFWAWEGVGCCEGTCTHVWNYAQALGRLFPELERSVREMQDLGEAFHPDGLVGFRGSQNGAQAADGQAGTVLKCYREHLLSPDDGFLKRNWPRIRKALEFSLRQDADSDGLIESSQHNTYDINFEGPNTFVGALYLAALRAGEEMAREMGEVDFAGALRDVFESGRARTEERLWNGEYFIQLVDLKKHPRDQYGGGCLSDQLFGQNWAHQLGLGYLYAPDKVRTALRSIWKYNWAPDVGPQNAAHKPERWFVIPGEAGLFTCTWPRSEHLKEGVRYRDEVWTGIEHQVASHMIREGMLEEALVMIRGIHDRYDASKRNPFNEVECGDHYARALASWGAIIALTGFEHHGPQGRLAFVPRITPHDFAAVFTASEGWGVYRQRRAGNSQSSKVEVRWGRLRVRTLALAPPGDRAPRRVAAMVGGYGVNTTFTFGDGRVTIDFGREVLARAGESIEVAFA